MPPTRSSASIGSRSTSIAIRNGVRRSGCGKLVVPLGLQPRLGIGFTEARNGRWDFGKLRTLDLMIGFNRCAHDGGRLGY